MPHGDLRDHVLRRRSYVWPPTSGNAYPRWALDLAFSVIDDETPLIDLFLAETTPLIGRVANLEGEAGSYRWHGGNYTATKQAEDPRAFFHDRINETVAGHRVVQRLCLQAGIPGCPPDSRTALDWAYAGYRLSSLRTDRASHPLEGDHRVPVAVHGIRAVVTQPDFSPLAKVKRAGWFAATAVAPDVVARRLVKRAFLSPPIAATFSPAPGGRTRDTAQAEARPDGTPPAQP
jgi:hypothetical protein